MQSGADDCTGGFQSPCLMQHRHARGTNTIDTRTSVIHIDAYHSE